MLLIDGEPEVEQFELSIVPIEEVSARGAVLSRTSHVLPEAVQGGAFLGIPFGVIAISVLYIMFEGVYPVDLVGGLERRRYHGDLRHDGRACWLSIGGEAGLVARHSVIRSLQGCDASLRVAGCSDGNSTVRAQPRYVSREDEDSGIITATRSVQEEVEQRCGVGGRGCRDDARSQMYASSSSGAVACTQPAGQQCTYRWSTEHRAPWPLAAAMSASQTAVYHINLGKPPTT